MAWIHLSVAAAIEIPLSIKSSGDVSGCQECPSESISRLLLITTDSGVD